MDFLKKKPPPASGRGLILKPPDFLENTVAPERKFAGEVGYPSRASRKGKTSPLEAGRGKYSPPANLERVTSEALKRWGNGVRL